MSANCGDYGERRGVGICNEFPIAFMPHILWFCASAIKAEHPQGLEMDKSDMVDWAWAFGWAVIPPSAARLGPFILLVLFIADIMPVLIPPFLSSCSYFLTSFLLCCGRVTLITFYKLRFIIILSEENPPQ